MAVSQGQPQGQNNGGEPKAPQGYKPLSSGQRTEWNNFLDYLGSQGNIDLTDPQVGVNFLNQYKKNNPNFSLTPQDISNIQYDQYQLRKGNQFGDLNNQALNYIRQGLPATYLNKSVGEVNGVINPATSKLYYPQVGTFGTDIEGYYNAKTGKYPPAEHSVAPLGTAALKQKYSTNPYLMEQGRYNWGAKLNNTFPIAGGNVKDAVVNAAKLNGIDPALLYGSAMEEGMSGAVDPKYSGTASEAYVDWATKNSDKASQYPVDSFFSYGLDMFADQAGALEKKGYLPKGFADRFTKFSAKNEKGEPLNAAAFKTDADALIAKSAMMKQSQDQLEDFSKKSGVTLSPAQKEFFLLANYNGGEGLMKKMIQSYKDKGYLKNDKFLDVHFKPESYGGVYKNVQARLQSAHQLKNERYF